MTPFHVPLPTFLLGKFKVVLSKQKWGLHVMPKKRPRILTFFHNNIQKMRQPGIEPGSTAWKAAMLTTIPLTLVEEEGGVLKI